MFFNCLIKLYTIVSAVVVAQVFLLHSILIRKRAQNDEQGVMLANFGTRNEKSNYKNQFFTRDGLRFEINFESLSKTLLSNWNSSFIGKIVIKQGVNVEVNI